MNTKDLLRPAAGQWSLSVLMLALCIALQDTVTGGLRRAAARAGRRDRGDVPGWVLITVMTVALVGMLWALARDQIIALFQNSLDSAKGVGSR